MTINQPANHQIPALRRLWKQAFGDPDAFIESFFREGFTPDHCRCIWEDNQLAAALYWFDCRCKEQRLAYIYGVATDTAYRHKGYCHALMEDALHHLTALGYVGAILVPAGEKLRMFYKNMGFCDFGGIREFTCLRGGQAIHLQKISAEEYARLRPDFLPAESVLQTGKTLSFLSAYTEFYAGENVLFTLYREDETAFVAELLGDSSVADAILKTLHLPSGRFRVPGADPFAMCRPLSEHFQEPCYFGLALD